MYIYIEIMAANPFGNTGCGQIQAEVWHDGLPKDNDPLFDKTLDALQNNCSNFAQNNHPRFTDSTFVRYIFNTPTPNASQAKEYVTDRGRQNPQLAPQAQAPNPNTIYYTGQARNPNPNPSQGSPYLTNAFYTGSIYSFDGVTINPNVMRALINTIIARCAMPPSSNINPHSGVQELYLFIDTAHNLIEAMNQVMTPTDPFLNVINSQISLADSCTAGKKLYNTHFYNNRLKSWWYQKNIVVPPYGIIVPTMSTFPMNLIFHTNLTCELRDAGAQEWSDKKISQKWTDSTFTPPVITNANKENKITSVIKSFNASIGVKKKSWCYQRKRSGDGFQIWFIYYFSYYLSKINNGPFFCTCKNGIAQHYPTTQDWLPPSPTNNTDDIRARSFFVTLDWPAFCWAAYCHMNVIFYIPGGNVILFIANPNGYSVLPVA
jgi:hypothetical protein